VALGAVAGAAPSCRRPAPPAPVAPAWRWLSPRPQGNDLHRVVSPDGHRLFAVGAGGTILRSTDAGTTWALMPTPTRLPLAALTGDRGLLVAVGARGTVLVSTDDGAHFVVQPSRTTENLTGVWWNGANNLFAVGWHGTILRSTDGGAAWTSLPSGTGVNLEAVHGQGDDVYVAGEQGVILAGSGDAPTWKRLATPTTSDLHALWVTPVGDVIAAGDEGALLRSSDRGASFARAAPLTRESLLDLWGLGGELVVCGTGGALLRSVDGGATFTALAPPPAGLLAVGGTREALVVAGSFGAILVSRDRGAHFAPAAPGTRTLLAGAALSGGHLYTGGDGVVLRDLVSVGAEPAAYGSVATSGNDVYVVASDRLLRATDGGPFVASAPAPGARLLGVAAAGARVVVVGARGTFLRSDDRAASFTALPPVTAADLAAAWIAGSGAAVAVGAGGTVVRDGTVVPTPAHADLGAVWGRGDELWAAGRAGTLLRSPDGGATWSLVTVPAEARQDLHGGCATAADVWVVGDAGTIFRAHGTAPFALDRSPTANALRAVACDAARAVAVGAGGTVIERRP
jgi:photosystem II stability/assembly factor-like uncharacterized protein